LTHHWQNDLRQIAPFAEISPQQTDEVPSRTPLRLWRRARMRQPENIGISQLCRGCHWPDRTASSI